MKTQHFCSRTSNQYDNIRNGTLSVIPENKMNQNIENLEETKQTNPKMPRKSTLGLSSFTSNKEASPYGDRYIPKRKDHDSDIAFYEINHENSPP